MWINFRKKSKPQHIFKIMQTSTKKDNNNKPIRNLKIHQ